MNNDLLEAMRQYNELVERLIKAEVYFNRRDIEYNEKLTQVNQLKLLTNNLAGWVKHIESLGYDMTDEEISLGFRQVKHLEVAK